MPLGKINVLTGANNSGKSSVLYAALTLKSLVSNPNRSLDAILTLPFINLGGFKEIVHLKKEESEIEIGIQVETPIIPLVYGVKLGKDESLLFLSGTKSNKIELNVVFPYPTNKTILFSFNDLDSRNKATNTIWNGFQAESAASHSSNSVNTHNELLEIDSCLSIPIKLANNIDYSPYQRGFTKVFFGAVPLQNQITTEDEIASLIALDRDLESNIAFYFEKIVDKILQVRFTLGTSNFYLQTRDKQTGFTTDLVNEGSGINQLVTILAKTLKKGSDFICIDEPEIHLHPTYISRLAEVLVEIAENESKQFLLSTHSEHLVSSLLNLLISKKLAPEDLKIFYCSKPKKETQIELQAVNEKGQIEGGFKSFIDAELQTTKAFFKIR